MNILAMSQEATATNVAIVSAPDQLGVFCDPENAAAIWSRKSEPGFQKWINHVDPDHLPKGRLILAVNEVDGAIQKLCDAAQTPQGHERDHLQSDVSALAKLFAGLMNVRFIRLRMDVVTTNACRKFHVDAVTARLVCTYRGTGTQYGVSQNGDDPGTVSTVPTGSPILLHGSLRPKASDNCLLHRSPPIEGTGETRLVLVIDPVFDPEDAL